MTTAQLFIRKYEHLEGLSKSRDPYDCLEMARLIRDLLISDQHGLVSQLLRERVELRPRRRRIEFYVNKLELFGDVGWLAEGIVPDVDYPNNNIVKMSRDSFFAYKIFKHHQTTRTVLDIVKFMANKEGAVHRDRANTDLLLLEIQETFGIGGGEGISSSILGIAQTVTFGLKDIYLNTKSSS